MVLSPDFREFVTLLNAHDVRYLLIGGYAVAFHGHPRYTKDLDIWIETSAENATAILAALAEFGFGNVGLTVDDFANAGQTIQLGYPPNRIDILTEADGVNFAACYAAKMEIEIDGLQIKIIGLNQLRQNKQASGRYQDLADLENLQ